jgi:hypothetical protein
MGDDFTIDFTPEGPTTEGVAPEDLPSNVVKLHHREREPKLMLVVEKARSVCHPHHFIINGVERTVRCDRCNTIFDPILALLDISRDWQNYRWNREDLKHQIERLTATREALRREVSNLKAQKKRAGTSTSAR